MTLFRELEAYYLGRVMGLVLSATKSPIVWQEVFDNGVDMDDKAVVHVRLLRLLRLLRLSNWEMFGQHCVHLGLSQ